MKTESSYFVGRATPDAAGKARPTVNHLTVMIYVKLNNKDAPCWLACINPHSYVAALDENEFSDALHAADWLIPDGSGIVLASHVLGGNIRQRITGSDIFYALNSKANELGGFSVFFLVPLQITWRKYG